MQFITKLKFFFLIALVGAFGIINLSFSYFITKPSNPQTDFNSHPGSLKSTTIQVTQSFDKIKYELIQSKNLENKRQV